MLSGVRESGAGGREQGEFNTQHPTSNAQHPTSKVEEKSPFGSWMFDSSFRGQGEAARARLSLQEPFGTWPFLLRIVRDMVTTIFCK